MKEKILEIVKTKKDSFVQIIKAYHKEFYIEINTKFEGKNFAEKLYRWFNVDKKLGCKLCVKPTKFLTFDLGFREYCSTKCANIGSADVRSEKMTKTEKDLQFWEEKECELCKTKFWVLKFRKQRFCSNECSSKTTANDVNRLNKIKETKLERYGDANFVNTEKAKRTCLERYGVDNASKTNEIKEKIKQVNLEKYGCDYSWQNDDVKNKIKQTNLERYGVEYATQNEEIKEKVKQTNIEKFGVDNYFKLKDKLKEINNEKYGVDYPSQNQEIKDKIFKNRNITIYDKNRIKSEYKVDFLFGSDSFLGIDKEHIYKFQCKFCQEVFYDHLDGNGHPRCLTCFPNIQGFSLAEKEIYEYILQLLPNEIVLKKDRSILNNKELDIFIPNLKLAIEYNGLYWHSELGGNKDKNYHLDKMNDCNNKNIRLIHIFEDEWALNKEIVKSRLKHILGLNTDNRIFARKCVVKEIDDRMVCNNFFNNTHLQGAFESFKIAMGLYYNDELVSVMSFGSCRLALGQKSNNVDEYEMYRYSTSKNVIGGASKLLSCFIRKYKPVKIISYADRRWSSGNLYEKLGFKKISDGQVNYWYFKPGYIKRHHRFSYRKDQLSKKLELFDPNLTEWQNMQNNGWDRIWDCGNIKYELVIK